MKIFGKIFGYLLALAILAVPFAAYAERNSLRDWWLLRDYAPPAAVVQLAKDDTMTAYATRIFYVNRPAIISDATTFRSQCTATEQTIVLGCYHSDQRGIYVYDVKDNRLEGVEQVTAAHEMLHAAYDRLEVKEKENINNLLLNYYRNEVKDPRLVDTINSYKKTEPGEVVNEMHSIFGTEISNLPPQLESYYKRYFSNRSAVALLAARYKGEFSRRVDQIKTDDEKLQLLKNQINAKETSLSLQLADLQASRARLDNLRGTGQIPAYNDGVPSYNAKVNSYNSRVSQLQQDIATYNQLVTVRNSIANELRQLDKALSSDYMPEPHQ